MELELLGGGGVRDGLDEDVAQHDDEVVVLLGREGEGVDGDADGVPGADWGVGEGDGLGEEGAGAREAGFGHPGVAQHDMMMKWNYLVVKGRGWMAMLMGFLGQMGALGKEMDLAKRAPALARPDSDAPGPTEAQEFPGSVQVEGDRFLVL